MNRASIVSGHAPDLDEIIAWLCQHVQAQARLSADSRQMRGGDVFLAYPVGNARQRSDSRDWLAQAAQAGAAAVLYDPADDFRLPDAIPAPVLPVAGLAALAGDIAAAWTGVAAMSLRVVGVTGTNGKTSVTQWLAQALDGTDGRCAIIGTMGSGFPDAVVPTGFTTPDAPRLQHSLRDLHDAGARIVAMEVSSHGLDQGRVNGVRFDTAVFTNLTQDHLDYHGDMAEYEAAKRRLFAWPGLRHAVINGDDPAGRRLLQACAGTMQVIETRLAGRPDDGVAHDWVCADGIAGAQQGTTFNVCASIGGVRHEASISARFVGEFNVHNALSVLGVLLAGGMTWQQAVRRIGALKPVCGRMELLGGQSSAPLVVVDYAHTPDALEKALHALRPVAAARKGRLICLFGCGGDRDAGKRPLMGAAAERLADAVVLTSDNPRSENPEQIIDMIAQGLSNPQAARCVTDRAAAILQALRQAAPGDVVLIAGKGHEATQEIAGRKLPFSDQEHVRLALAARGVLA